MARVFVPEPKNFYFKRNTEGKATKYGKIVPLTTEDSKLGLEPDRIKAYVARAILSYEDDDYLLLDGSNVHCSVCASMIAATHNGINLLLWNSNTKEYEARRLILSDIPKPIVQGGQPKMYITNYVHTDPPQGYTSIVLSPADDKNLLEPELIKKSMVQILKMSCADDMLVPSGSKSHCVVGSTIMSIMHGKVNYMIWHDKTERFLLRRCSFNQDDIRWLAIQE